MKLIFDDSAEYIGLTDNAMNSIIGNTVSGNDLLRKVKDAFDINPNMYLARVFDWEKAARIISSNPNVCYHAGLLEDWYYTSDVIWINGKHRNHNAYLFSQWATPIIVSSEDDTYTECWVHEVDRPEWDAETSWPKEAQDIICVKGGE